MKHLRFQKQRNNPVLNKARTEAACFSTVLRNHWLNFFEIVDWLKSITKLPIILKGILTADDAREAVAHRVGVIVSNTAERQLDYVPATASAYYKGVGMLSSNKSNTKDRV